MMESKVVQKSLMENLGLASIKGENKMLVIGIGMILFCVGIYTGDVQFLIFAVISFVAGLLIEFLF